MEITARTLEGSIACRRQRSVHADFQLTTLGCFGGVTPQSAPAASPSEPRCPERLVGRHGGSTAGLRRGLRARCPAPPALGAAAERGGGKAWDPAWRLSPVHSWWGAAPGTAPRLPAAPGPGWGDYRRRREGALSADSGREGLRLSVACFCSRLDRL